MSVLGTRSVRGVLRTSESESESLDGSIRVGFRFRDPCFGSGSLAAALRRGERFWSMAASAIAHYRYTAWVLDNQADEAKVKAEWERLHALYAPQALATILELRGLYIKFGQV